MSELPWLLLLQALLVSVGYFFLLWCIYRFCDNAAVVDVGWGSNLVVVGAFLALAGDGDIARRWLAWSLAAVWGLRLSWHLLFSRLIGKAEEGRYQQLRWEWKTHIPFKFLLFYQAQALFSTVFAIPLWILCANAQSGILGIEWLAAAIIVISVWGEAAADAQLETFKNKPETKGQVCEVGLWRYSRHPNYFFEWLVWVGFALAAWPSPGGYLALICPLLILFFLFKVTGIPATEAQALRSRGEAYRRYQQTTSVFIPWFRKEAA